MWKYHYLLKSFFFFLPDCCNVYIDFYSFFRHVIVRNGPHKFVFTLKTHPGVSPGAIGFSLPQVCLDSWTLFWFVINTLILLLDFNFLKLFPLLQCLCFGLMFMSFLHHFVCLNLCPCFSSHFCHPLAALPWAKILAATTFRYNCNICSLILCHCVYDLKTFPQGLKRMSYQALLCDLCINYYIALF